MIRKILAALALLSLPFLALAHGGVSKNVGSVVVYLDQSPISPLVGENVDMTFVIRDSQNQAVANWPVTLTLTDTAYNDPAHDKQILTKSYTTDANGGLDFNYRFYKQNFFDLDLDFKDPKDGNALNTGFLVQPRAAVSYYWLLPAILLGLLVGWMAARRLQKAPKQTPANSDL